MKGYYKNERHPSGLYGGRVLPHGRYREFDADGF
jgi:hypothetical protein